MPSLETNKLLSVAVDACDSRKAEDIRILALDPSESALTDYFLICSGTNTRQNVAIADEIEHRLKQEFGVYPVSVEGRREGEWVLMDYVDFVVHVFMPEKRAYYGLERLKKSAKSLTLQDLHAEMKAAVAASRAKAKPAVKAASAAKKAAGKSPAGAAGAKSAAKSVVKKAAAVTAKKAAAKKSAPAKKTPVKVSAGKKAAKKAPAKRPAK